MANGENRKHQLSIFSTNKLIQYVFRTDSDEEILNMSGVKELKAGNLLNFVENLSNAMPVANKAIQATEFKKTIKTPQDIVVGVPKCQYCGGEMWDNRGTRKGRQPHFKCKDRVCNAAAWLRADGSLGWKKQAAPYKSDTGLDSEMPF